MDKKSGKKENICRSLVEVLKLTDRCRELYAMTYIESQDSVIAYFHGRRIVRVWLDGIHDELEMIREIVNVLNDAM